MRRNWQSLNGEWDFTFLDINRPKCKIQVPFVYQCERSGVNEQEISEHVEYTRTFTVPANWQGQEILLHFGAVDYYCEIYVNGKYCGNHTGGSAPFHFNITPHLTGGEETVTVRVHDPLEDETIPRGKQFWEAIPHAIWYTQTTGIWQSVWLEPVHKTRLTELRFTPDVDSGSVQIEYEISGLMNGLTLHTDIEFDGQLFYSGSNTITDTYQSFSVNLYGRRIFRSTAHQAGLCWSPERPNLFDVKLRLTQDGQEVDNVTSYFGMRKIECRGDRIYLKNHAYYQRLVLDQGYWKESLLTAPDDDAFKTDILMAKELGFNGCRKHQKAEDPRADKLGFLVWGEVPSAPSYSAKTVERLTNEWFEIIRKDLSTLDNLLAIRFSDQPVFAEGYGYNGEPVMLTEFGGIAFNKNQSEGGWGYTFIADEEDYISTYRRLLTDIYDSACLWGFCYTQLTDVQQEMNGMLTEDRQFKCDPQIIREINNGWN